MGVVGNVTVVVSTYGDAKWKYLAGTRAIPSAEKLRVPVIYNHGTELHLARNDGLTQVKTEWVCHLDADDELEPGFFDEIEKVEGDLIGPAVRYVIGGSRTTYPQVPKVFGHTHACVGDCLYTGNWLVVGAVARAEMLLKVGGWRNYPCYEDFDLWQRCWVAGASVVAAPKAVYRAHSSNHGRNTALPPNERRKVHYAIAKENLPNENWEWLLP